MLRFALTAGALFLGAIDTSLAVRVLEDTEHSAELALSQIDLPATATGILTFKACESCRVSAHRLTSMTAYVVNGRELPFAELMRTVDEIAAVKNAAEQTLVGVFFDVQSGNVTRIALHTRAR